MSVTEAIWLILSLALALGGLGWALLQFILLKREWVKTEAERRSLDYQLMRASTRWEAERQDLQQALLRCREKRAQDAKAAAMQAQTLKTDLLEALELALAYRQIGGPTPDAMLAKLRDDVSEFGHLLDAQSNEVS